MKEKIDFIDEFLSTCEDWMHGKDGSDVTKCRKYLHELSTDLKKLRVADVSGCVCDEEDKHGWTEVKCCNECGLSIEEW